MSNETYMAGILLLMVISLIPQVAAAYLCFRWQKFPRRRWVRLVFGGSWLVLSTFVVFRIVTVFAYYDVLTVMFIAAASSAAMHYVNTGVLWAATHVFEKRFASVAATSHLEARSASNILAGVIDDLVVEGRKKGWL